MNKRKRLEETFEGFVRASELPAYAGFVITGDCGPLARFVNALKKRTDIRVIECRMDSGPLCIVYRSREA